MTRFLTVTIFVLTSLALIPEALAGDWHVVGDIVYRDSDGKWTAWLSDGEGNHINVSRGTKRKTRKAAEDVADALNAQGCVDPCHFEPEGCFPMTFRAMTPTTGENWEVVALVELADGTYNVRVMNDDQQGVVLRRATQEQALAAGHALAAGFNDLQCMAIR